MKRRGFLTKLGLAMVAGPSVAKAVAETDGIELYNPSHAEETLKAQGLGLAPLKEEGATIDLWIVQKPYKKGDIAVSPIDGQNYRCIDRG